MDRSVELLTPAGNFRNLEYAIAYGADAVYESVRLNLPWAKGISVKGAWDIEGNHPGFNLEKCIQIALEAGYRGFWGIESVIRGDRAYLEKLNPAEKKKIDWQAVNWTKAVINKIVFPG